MSSGQTEVFPSILEDRSIDRFCAANPSGARHLQNCVPPPLLLSSKVQRTSVHLISGRGLGKEDSLRRSPAGSSVDLARAYRRAPDRCILPRR